MSDLTFPDFKGRVVALELEFDDESPFAVLENTRFEVQGGRVFILGQVPQGVTEEGWCAGASCGVSWDKVVTYYLFDSVDDYLQSVGEV